MRNEFSRYSYDQRWQSSLEDVLSVPIVAEVFDVKPQNVEIGRVRISTRVAEKQQLADAPLERDEVEVERITLNQAAEHAIPVRVKGNVTIVSLYEEVAVFTQTACA